MLNVKFGSKIHELFKKNFLGSIHIERDNITNKVNEKTRMLWCFVGIHLTEHQRQALSHDNSKHIFFKQKGNASGTKLSTTAFGARDHGRAKS